MRRLRRFALLLLVPLAYRGMQLSLVDPSMDDARARLAYLEHRLDAEDLPGWGPTGVIQGEWRIVTLSATALATANLAFRGVLPKARALARVQTLANRVLSSNARRFDTDFYGADALRTLATDDGHAGALGHIGLVLGAECLLGDPTTHAERRTAIAETLARRHAASRDGLIDTYPGRVWIPDNAASLAALALHERCTRADGDAPLAKAQLGRWPIDAATGLLTFFRDGDVRASGATWNGLYLPFVDPGFAADQFTLARAQFETRLLLGATAFREYRRGEQRDGDVDSGPLVFGLSPSGTGFALAGAALANDEALVKRLLMTAEGAGITFGFSGRRYLLAPLVGDATVLAARTSTRWDRRFLPAEARIE